MLFRKNGTGEFQRFKQNMLSANFVGAQVSTGYQDEESSYIVSVVFHNPNKNVTRNVGLLNDKFPIISKSERHLLALVGDAQVTVSCLKVPNNEVDVAELAANGDLRARLGHG